MFAALLLLSLAGIVIFVAAVAGVASCAAALARERARKGKLMADQQIKPDILVYGPPKPVVISGLSRVHACTNLRTTAISAGFPQPPPKRSGASL